MTWPSLVPLFKVRTQRHEVTNSWGGHTNFCPVWPLRPVNWNYRQKRSQDRAHKLLPCLAMSRQLKLQTEEVTRWGTQTSVLSGHCVPSTETIDRRDHRMGHTNFCPVWPCPVNWNYRQKRSQDGAHKLLSCLATAPHQLKLRKKEVTRWGTQTSVLSGHCVPSYKTGDKRGHKMGHTNFCPGGPLQMGHTNFCPVWPLRPVNWNFRQKRSQDGAHKLLSCLATASRQLKLWTGEVTR